MAKTLQKMGLMADIGLPKRRAAARAMDEIRKRHKRRRGEKSSTEIIREFRDRRRA